MALASLCCSPTCATCNLSTVLGSFGVCNATWPRHLPGWAVISQQTASNKAICGHLGHARNGHSTVSQQDNTRVGEVSRWKDDTQCWGPLPNLWPEIYRCFFPHQTSRKIPHPLENQEIWTVKEMELSQCSWSMDSLLHGGYPHCFGHDMLYRITDFTSLALSL